MRVVVDNGPGKGRRPQTTTLSAKPPRTARPVTTLRAAVAADAPALHALIAAHLEEGRLLPRTLPHAAGVRAGAASLTTGGSPTP